MRKFIISGRELQGIIYVNEKQYVKDICNIYKLPKEQIDSVYGFINRYAPLYGGRVWGKADKGLSIEKILALNYNQIAFGLAISNSFFEERAYFKTKRVIEKMPNHDLNYVIIANDELSMRVRKDFPNLKQKMSCIQEVDSLDGIYDKLSLYDEITLHVDQNLRAGFISSIPEDLKSKVILFGIGQCATFCKNKICYTGVSLKNLKKENKGYSCIKKVESSPNKPPSNVPFHISFDLSDSMFDGFNKIKLPSIAKNMCKLLGK